MTVLNGNYELFNLVYSVLQEQFTINDCFSCNKDCGVQQVESSWGSWRTSAVCKNRRNVSCICTWFRVRAVPRWPTLLTQTVVQRFPNFIHWFATPQSSAGSEELEPIPAVNSPRQVRPELYLACGRNGEYLEKTHAHMYRCWTCNPFTVKARILTYIVTS